MKKIYLVAVVVLVVLISGCAQNQNSNTPNYQKVGPSSLINQPEVSGQIKTEYSNKCLSCCEKAASKIVTTNNTQGFCNYLCRPIGNETEENLTKGTCEISELEDYKVKEMIEILDLYSNIN